MSLNADEHRPALSACQQACEQIVLFSTLLPGAEPEGSLYASVTEVTYQGHVYQARWLSMSIYQSKALPLLQLPESQM